MKVDRMGLTYKEYGNHNGPLIVFLHGGGVSSWMWDKQVNYFKHYHCITIDLPEHGANKHAEEFSIHRSAKSIIDIIEKHRQEKEVIVIGFSLGAQVLVEMLSLRSDLIDYALINSALVRPSSVIRKLIRPSIYLFFPLVKMKSFAKLQAKALYISEEYIDTYYKESSQMNRETLIRILEENMSFQIPQNFRHAKGKILVTIGEKENAMMKKSAKDLVQANPTCTGVIIPKVGHGISLFDPEYFNRLVEGWIEGGRLPRDVGRIS